MGSICTYIIDNLKHSYFTIIIYRNSCLFPLENNTVRDVVVGSICTWLYYWYSKHSYFTI